MNTIETATIIQRVRQGCSGAGYFRLDGSK